MDKIDLEFLNVGDKCITITVHNPEKVQIHHGTTKGTFADFPVDAILTVSGNNGPFEFVRVETLSEIPYIEECRLRKENTLVREIYEEYKVALILAYKGE